MNRSTSRPRARSRPAPARDAPPACASVSDCARRRRRRSRFSARAAACGTMRATAAAVSAVSVAAPSSTRESSNALPTQSRKSLRSSDFGGGAAKNGCVKSRAIIASSTMPARGLCAVGIERLAGAQPHEIVEQRIAGPGVAGDQIVAVDISDVGDAAEIEHRDRRLARRIAGPRRDGRPAPAARPARRPRRRRSENRRPPECRAAAPACGHRRSARSDRARAGAAASGRGSRSTATSSGRQAVGGKKRLARPRHARRSPAPPLSRSRRPRGALGHVGRRGLGAGAAACARPWYRAGTRWPESRRSSRHRSRSRRHRRRPARCRSSARWPEPMPGDVPRSRWHGLGLVRHRYGHVAPGRRLNGHLNDSDLLHHAAPSPRADAGATSRISRRAR